MSIKTKDVTKWLYKYYYYLKKKKSIFWEFGILLFTFGILFKYHFSVNRESECSVRNKFKMS